MQEERRGREKTGQGKGEGMEYIPILVRTFSGVSSVSMKKVHCQYV